MTLHQFLTRFGDRLAERVTQTCHILHDPARDRAKTQALDAKLASLLRPCYPAQAEAAKALARAFFEQGDRAAYLCGEMGVGKCEMSLALLALAPRPLRALVMCPPHLVPKWQREATLTLPQVKVVDLGGRDSLRRLCRLAALKQPDGSLPPPTTPELWVLGRERAKLHHHWRPAVASRLQVIQSERGSHTIERNPACTRCGAFLVDEDGIPLSPLQLARKHLFCEHCRPAARRKQSDQIAHPVREAAFAADREGPRRYSPAQYIQRHLKGAFHLFVADEVHELKGESTGQGNAFGALAGACQRTLSLTGTLLGGYADNLFHLLWRSHGPSMKADGLDYRRVMQFMERYGRIERVTRISPDGAWDARTVRGKNRNTSVRRKPGISPLILGKHLLPTTVFLRLADVAEALPPYEERVVSLAMSPELAAAYRRFEGDLLKHVRAALACGSKHLLATYLQSLLCYPDEAAFREAYVRDSRTDQVLAAAPRVPGPLPKEQELVELCTREVRQEHRHVLVYVSFTNTKDITPRLQRLLRDAGLRVAVLKGSVEPGRREAWIQEQVQEGTEVLIANPELVKTGLDLYEWPTFIFYETGYSIYTLRQAARRAWRIGQHQPCRVIFLTYEETMQSKALTLIATKLEASLAVEGELSADGLSVLADTPDSLILELARALVDKVGSTESAEAVWARLRKRDVEQLLTLTAAKPAPPVETITESITRIGDRLLLVDLIEHTAPRRKRVSRLEVKEVDLQTVLKQRPHLAQLALF